MRVFRKFRASDGRIKIATLSGVSALVAVIALLVGVLPVMADGPGSTVDGIDPVQVDWGGGEGACDDALINLEEGDDKGTARGPSSARYDAHLQNPKPGENVIFGNDPDETKITITVDEENGRFFEFSIDSDHLGAYDVVVNGGKKSNHYGYVAESNIVPSDEHLSAPIKDNKDEVHNLSHINVCYDVTPVSFVCDKSETLEGEGLITEVEAAIFTNSLYECTDKDGFFFIDGDTATLDFGDGSDTVAGRLDVTKVFVDESGDPDPSFEPLEYSATGDPNDAVVLDWCNLRDKDTDPDDGDGVDGNEFDDVLDPNDELAAADTSYPSTDGATALSDGNVACKVAEFEDATGTQVTVVYFEFNDPTFH